MDNKLSLNSSSVISFEPIFEIPVLKYMAVPFSILMTIVICCLCAGIIWYEQCGSDLKRILINQLVSSFGWIALNGYILIVVPDLLMYFYRPLPLWFCYLNILYRNIVVVYCFLLLDAIIIVRYAFIFWLKDPLSFMDTFWCIFINVCCFIMWYTSTSNKRTFFWCNIV